MYSKKTLKYILLYGMLNASPYSYAVLNNPPPNTTVSASETINYTIAVNASNTNNLNISNGVSAGQTYNVNVLNGGAMTNSSIFEDILSISGGLSCNIFVVVNSGGAITHNSISKEMIDDDSSGGGTLRLTVNSGGSVVGRFTGNSSRTNSEIINAGTMQGSIFNQLTLVNNSGLMTPGNITAVTSVTNTGTIDGRIITKSSGGTVTNSGTIGSGITSGSSTIINNNGAGIINGGITLGTSAVINNNSTASINGSILGNSGTALNIGPTVSNAFSTGGNVENVATISLLNSSSLTVNNGHIVYGFTSISGARPVTINAGGIVQVDVANSLAITGALTNAGKLIINNTLNPTIYTPFTNPSGTIEVNAAGTITGNVSATGTSFFNIGTQSTKNFTTQGTISGFTTVKVDANSSSLTANHAISGVSTLFAVNSGCSATINAGLSGTGIIQNNGTLTLGTNPIVSGFSSFTNSNILRITGAAQNNVVITNNAQMEVAGQISGTGSINNINTGTLTVTGTSSNSVPITNNGNMVVSSALNNTATITNNNSLTLSSTLSGAGTVVNNNLLTFSAGSNNSNAITNNSSAIFNISGATTNAAAITNSGTINISAALTTNPGNSITNNSSGVITLTSNGSIGTTGALVNNGKFNIGNPYNTTSFINTGSLYVVGHAANNTGSITGNLSGGTSLFIGQDSGGTLNFNNFTTGGTISGIPIIRVFNGSSFTTNSSVSGVNNSFTVDSGATATLNSSFTGSGTATNNGTLNINSGSTFGLSGLSNSGSVFLRSLNNTPITNLSGATLTFGSGASNSGSINNNSGGTFNITGASTSSALITNSGNMNVNAPLTNTNTIVNNNNLVITSNIPGTGTVTNNSAGLITFSGSSNMSGQTLNSTGRVTLNSPSAVQVASYTNSNIHNTEITNATTFGQLTSIGAVNLSGSTINVFSDAVSNGSWTIISGASLAGPAQINLPNIDSFLQTWSSDVTSTEVNISLINVPFASVAIGEFNIKVAEVLDAMAANVTNSGQQDLLNAFINSPTQDALNAGLQQMIPNLNASAPDIMLQNAIFGRVENRIAKLSVDLARPIGIAAGDINPTSAMWIGSFGSIAKQQAINENPGYKANSFGAVIGFDTRLDSGGIFGMGLGLSKTIVKEYSNKNFTTDIIGYHILGYATKCLPCEEFLEVLGTAAVTDNSGSRAIDVNSIIMGTTSSYRGAQGGFRLNYGKNFDFNDIFTVAPIAMMQYALLYSPDYYESYSPAALHVTPDKYQSVLTFGGGLRMSLPSDEWWLVGSRELRAMVTYDAIASNNLTTANFLVGSNDFSVATTPKRLALRLGLDLTFNILEHLQLLFEYDYEVRHEYVDNSGTIKLRYLF